MLRGALTFCHRVSMGGLYGRERVTGERAVKHLEPIKVFFATGATIAALAAATVAAWSTKVDASAFDAHIAQEDTRVRSLENAEAGHSVRLGNLEAGQKWQMDVQYRTAERLGVLAAPPPQPSPVPSPHPQPSP